MDDKTQNKMAVLMVNSECNLRCRHCFIPYEGHMEPSEAMEIAAGLREKGYRIRIFGSEPLMDKRYLDLFPIAGQDILATNGLLLLKRPELTKELADKGITKLQVSYHHDIDEILRSANSEQVKRIISIAAGSGIGVQLATTITSKNYLKAGECCEFAYEAGAYAIKFLKFMRTGRARDMPSSDCLSDSQVADFFDIVLQQRQKYVKDKLEIRVHGSFGPRKGTKGEEMARANCYCPAGERIIYIDPDYKIYACQFLMDRPIGVLDRNTLEANIEDISEDRSCCLADKILNRP